MHAKLSASGAHRWSACPASVQAEAAISDRIATTSIFAEEGTAAHELAALCLMGGKEPGYWLQKILPDSQWPVTQEMVDHVGEYVKYVRYHAHAGTISQYEVSVSYGRWVDGGFGTADAIIIDGQTLHVIDLKYGQGIAVSPIENTQLLLYALGAFDDFDFVSNVDTIHLTIVQPRIGQGEAETWVISADQLLERGKWFRKRAKLCYEPNPEYVPGEDQCRWCKANVTCTGLAKHIVETLSTEFEDITTPDSLPSLKQMGADKLSAALKARKLIMSWLESIEQYAIQQIDEGVGFPGFKLVTGRSNRKWADVEVAEKTLVELLADAAFNKSLLSPPQAEKVLGKKKAASIARLIIKPEGAPALVGDDDPRPAVGGSTVDDFD